jgi:serine/threonine protein kinase
MPLLTRTRIGSFEISSLIGVGGMGELYRARDTKLNRDVALKVLSENFANDPERLAGSNGKRRCFPHSTIRTSRTSTASRTPAARTRWVLAFPPV